MTCPVMVEPDARGGAARWPGAPRRESSWPDRSSARRRHEAAGALVIRFDASRSSAVMTTSRLFALAVIIGCVASRSASAQTGPGFTLESASQERLGENHLKLVGNVDTRAERHAAHADEVEYFSDQDRAIVAPGTSCSRKGTTASPRIAPISTPRRASGPFTTPAASPTSNQPRPSRSPRQRSRRHR